MRIDKLVIEENAFDINLVFYTFLKEITQAKFTEKQIKELLAIYYSNTKTNTKVLKKLFYSYLQKIERKDSFLLFNAINSINENTITIFIFSLKLILIKDLLLKEIKATQIIKSQELEKLNPLSLAYDNISTKTAYTARTSGALLSLLFFEKLENEDTNLGEESTKAFFENLKHMYKVLLGKGIKPNQIFMLLFSESINQSIISLAGVSYEDRIKNIFTTIGIPEKSIKKTHDKKDHSTEFDFFFKYENREYGISAKRTLRERYKQFIKTAQMSKLDIMIQITLGIDLRKNIANAIRKHGIYLFIADEVYREKDDLRSIAGIFPASKLNINLLKQLK